MTFVTKISLAMGLEYLSAEGVQMQKELKAYTAHYEPAQSGDFCGVA